MEKYSLLLEKEFLNNTVKEDLERIIGELIANIFTNSIRSKIFLALCNGTYL